MSDVLTQALLTALARNPGSDRSWALDAGLTQPTLAGVRAGRHGTTRQTVEALAEAAARRAYTWRRIEAELREALAQEKATLEEEPDQ